MRTVTVTIPDNFYQTFIEFFKHIPDAKVEEDDMDIPTWHKQILDERAETYEKSRGTGISWNDLKKDLDKI
jgi:hypothetical protein